MKCLFLYMSFILLGHSTVFAQDKILIIGDSLTEGYGVDAQYAYPTRLQEILLKNKLNYRVVNAGVSGATTASGLQSLKWYLKGKPKILIIALGANDGLRGIDVKTSEKNLEKMILLAKEKNIVTVIAGMQIPPNYGEDYGQKFKGLFALLARKYKLHLIPFLLEGVAGKKELNIEDGIHPNKDGHKVMASTVYKYIKELL